MGALVDLTCKKCRRRFGYAHGAPARCYHCGHVADTGEVDKLMDELKDFEDQSDEYDAITVAAMRMRVNGHKTAIELYRDLAYRMGADAEDVVAFMTQAKPLPVLELERVRKWMAEHP